MHIQKQIILCSDSEGRVHRVTMATKMVTEDVYPSISHPGAMTIDWLHNYTYIVDGLLVSLSTKLHCVFMSFRKPHVIGQKDDT